MTQKAAGSPPLMALIYGLRGKRDTILRTSRSTMSVRRDNLAGNDRWVSKMHIYVYHSLLDPATDIHVYNSRLAGTSVQRLPGLDV